MAGNLRVIFFGTPLFACAILRGLLKNDFKVVAVFTQPDKKRGRNQEVFPSPVKVFTLKHKIKIFQPVGLKDEKLVHEIAELKPDLIVTAAYGKIIPKEILSIPRFGAINVHASLLPKYRGASPVQQALLEGEKETGVTLMLMNEELDKGDIVGQEKVFISDNDNLETLSEKISKSGESLLVATLPLWARGEIEAKPQKDSQASYAKPVKKEDGRIDWHDTAETIGRKFRAYFPWPGVYSHIKKNDRLMALKIKSLAVIVNESVGAEPGKVVDYKGGAAVGTGKGLIILKKVQLEGKNEIEISDFLRGKKDFINSFLE